MSVAIQKQVADYIELLRELVVNGRKLTDQQIVGRAMFAATQGLDPITEVQTLVDREGRTIAHVMSMNGYRRKCQEQISPGSEISLEFIEIPRNRLPEGAYVGYECRLRVGDDYQGWLKHLVEIGRGLREAGGIQATFQDIVSLIGPPPVYTGIGIVYNAELSEHKDRNYPPAERAMKRAEMNARKKRFPTNAAIYDGGENGSPIVTEVDSTTAVSDPPAPELPATSPDPQREAELLHELGFGNPAPAPLPFDLPARITNIPMDVILAETSSNGKRYWDMSNEDLENRRHGIEKALAANMSHGKPLTEDDQVRLERKHQVIQAILNYRSRQE